MAARAVVAGSRGVLGLRRACGSRFGSFRGCGSSLGGHRLLGRRFLRGGAGATATTGTHVGHLALRLGGCSRVAVPFLGRILPREIGGLLGGEGGSRGLLRLNICLGFATTTMRAKRRVYERRSRSLRVSGGTGSDERRCTVLLGALPARNLSLGNLAERAGGRHLVRNGLLGLGGRISGHLRGGFPGTTAAGTGLLLDLLIRGHRRGCLRCGRCHRGSGLLSGPRCSLSVRGLGLSRPTARRGGLRGGRDLLG